MAATERIDSADLDRMIEAMGRDLADRLAGIDAPIALTGLETGGVWIAERLRRYLPERTESGALDVSFYRDDYAQRGLHAQPKPSRLPLSLDGCHVVLVDDVLASGRTVRAAINALFDRGRPAQVLLAVLIDRGGRELPLAADVFGARLDLPAEARVRLHGPAPLRLTIEQAT